MNSEPVRIVVAAIVVVMAVIQALGWVDASTGANIVGAVMLIVGGEVARSQVTPTTQVR